MLPSMADIYFKHKEVTFQKISWIFFQLKYQHIRKFKSHPGLNKVWVLNPTKLGSGFGNITVISYPDNFYG